ncbi:MAG: bifunctional DNA-formamidopyrimidine glycosylase/DNA-(apurinic or apyrimidinic site) lyase [Gammaproteobacteria bacterium]|nr:bifunctional DNA-formamidopyrimidine glycosylase/DNA-(apurinic or apyrimidinic site) lyase [Gammaproteobacteria bacterium]NNJ98079.1 bifunctional DNA-formamidopyrimidine glycosylase/DNA-(apurinic or apyrimidinic site) lyase [Gammaproteobacteria bacterium]
MPELPEVETTRRGIEPYINHQIISDVIIRQRALRWPVPKQLGQSVRNRAVVAVDRRGKYLLLRLDNGSIIIHLGMSGSLRICSDRAPFDKHDHVDIVFDNNHILRLRDPRKFGAVLWTGDAPENHPLLSALGPEPLQDEFNSRYFYERTRDRSASVKSVIMNSHIVVGVGNIYACESLYLAGINPKRKAGSLSLTRCERLVSTIKQVLNASISQGGTSLRDFVREDGMPGYYAQQLFVYGRAGEPCKQCGRPIKQIKQQQRSTFYCTQCQR